MLWWATIYWVGHKFTNWVYNWDYGLVWTIQTKRATWCRHMHCYERRERRTRITLVAMNGSNISISVSVSVWLGTTTGGNYLSVSFTGWDSLGNYFLTLHRAMKELQRIVYTCDKCILLINMLRFNGINEFKDATTFKFGRKKSPSYNSRYSGKCI